MTRFFIIAILSSFALFSKGQTQDSLYEKAFRFSSQNQADSAIIYLNKILLIAPAEKLPHLHLWLGKVYLENSQYNEAKKQFFLVVKGHRLKKSITSSQFSACHYLFDIFIKENNADEALKYLQLAEKKLSSKPILEFEEKAVYAYKYATYYKMKGKSDTVISLLTPYMFRKYGDFLGDTLKYNPLIELYTTTLWAKYGYDKAKEILLNSLKNNLEYSLDSTRNDVIENTHYHLRCSFELLGQKILLKDLDFYLIGGWEHTKEKYTKNFFIKYVEATPTYQALVKRSKSLQD